MNRYLDGVPINVSTIPTEIGLITNLKEFFFDSMSEILERGTIPSEIGNCREFYRYEESSKLLKDEVLAIGEALIL